MNGPANRGYTLSHHVALHAAACHGATTASRLLERANILTSGIGLPLPEVPGDYNGLRIGTQEIEDMPTLADLLCRVLVDNEEPESVKEDVLAFRARFQDLRIVL